MTKIDFPKLSVVTPTFNSEATIAACLGSVAEQGYPNVEHLVIDNQSTDQTIRIATEFKRKWSHLRIISEADKGIYDAMNKAIGLASGDWVYFLGSDDELVQGALTGLFERSDLRSLDLIYGNVRLKDSGVEYDGEFSLPKLFDQNICHQAMFFRKELFSTLGTFDPKYRSCADWDFTWRCFTDQRIRKAYLPLVIALYGERGFSSLAADEVFLRDKPGLVLNRSAGMIQPDELHRIFWPRLSEVLKKKRVFDGLGFSVRVGLQTRHPLLYWKAGLWWLFHRVTTKFGGQRQPVNNE